MDVRPSGGILQSEAILQMQADVFGLPISKLSSYERSSIGAAALALIVIGEYTSLDFILKLIRIEKTFKPIPNNQIKYQIIFNEFKNLYISLKLEFERVSN